jgi:signal peptidase II
MSRSLRVLVVGLLLVICIGCDQSTKLIAEAHLADAEPIDLLGGLVRLTYGENTGAFLGLGSGLDHKLQAWIFRGLVAAFLVGLLVYVIVGERLHATEVVALGLIIAGGAGNLVDRVWLGAVRDFAVVGIGRLSTGVFNVADVAVTGGGLLWLLRAILAPPQVEDEE